MLSLCLFQAMCLLCVWKRKKNCGRLPNFISIHISFSSLLLSLSSSKDSSSFSSVPPPSLPPPPTTTSYFSPLLSVTGKILLWDGSLASCGFNPAMGFLNFDNLLMEAGMKALACVNKRRPHTSLWEAAEGGRESKSSESWIWHSDKMPRCLVGLTLTNRTNTTDTPSLL